MTAKGEIPEGPELIVVLDHFLPMEEQVRWRMAALEGLLRSPLCLTGKIWEGDMGMNRRASIVYEAFPKEQWKTLTHEQCDRLSLLIEGKAVSDDG